MANNTVSKKDSGSSSSSHPGTNARPEAAAACKTPQCESWPTWCATCQALRAGAHICKNPDSAADEIAKPEPVYQRRLPHEAGTRRVEIEKNGKQNPMACTSSNSDTKCVCTLMAEHPVTEGRESAAPETIQLDGPGPQRRASVALCWWD
ncbi:hypothetical protein PGQ11_006936 [Apiospora arundinis]|uniref:Uncharacterized protein n=1 Tax=Apiospora arundinis TaxID=335852 RepID=A0ABR2IV37_9PEZI